MREHSVTIAGLRTLIVSPSADEQLDVVVLHGYAMTPEDFAPFARSLGVPARFCFPEGPRKAFPQGRAWWDTDAEARARSRTTGPRDLSADHPGGAALARECLLQFLADLRVRGQQLPLALVGFSQGGMLACDTFLRDRPSVGALALLSASRISADEWEPLARRMERVPVLISHGRADDDLAFSAGEALRDFLLRGGARVTWVPFEQGHEIPLVVWRKLRTFLSALS